MIEVISDHIPDFLSGEYVFKVMVGKKCVHIVTTLEEYYVKLKTHMYTPLLYKVDFYTRLAYVCGCLNLEYNKSRDTVFTFYIRKINTLTWKAWFSVSPEKDEIESLT